MQKTNPSVSGTGLDRIDALLAALAAALAIALYVRTLAPGILSGDSAEFQVLAWQVGSAHTTGYPVYMLLARMFLTVLPLGTIAWRVSLFSAFMGALAVAGAYLCARLLTRHRLAALGGALLLAVSATFWSQSIIAEVYAPEAAFLAAIWFALLAWNKTGRGAWLCAAGVLGGLSLGVHASMVMAAPAVLLFLLAGWPRWRTAWKPALLGGAAGVLLLGAAYLAVDLNAPPANSFQTIYGPARSAWNLTDSDVDTPVGRIRFLISSRQWSGNMFTDPARQMPAQWKSYTAGLPREFPAVALGFMVLGFLLVCFRSWRAGVLFAAAFAAHWLFTLNYQVWDIFVFYIPGYFWMAVLAGVGIGAAGDLLGRLPWPRVRSVLAPLALLAVGAALIVPGIAPRLNAIAKGSVPFSGSERFPQPPAYGKLTATIQAAPPDALFLVKWNDLYACWYAASIDLERTDLTFIEMNPYHQPPTFPESTVAFIREAMKTRRVFLAESLTEVMNAGFQLVKVDLAGTAYYEVKAP